MNNLNDIGKFDSMFKGAATDYELPFNEDAWNLMSIKLDNEQAKKKRGGWLWWLPLIAIALSGSIYFISKNNVSKTNKNTGNEFIVNSNNDLNEIKNKKQNKNLITSENNIKITKPTIQKNTTELKNNTKIESDIKLTQRQSKNLYIGEANIEKNKISVAPVISNLSIDNTKQEKSKKISTNSNSTIYDNLSSNKIDINKLDAIEKINTDNSVKGYSTANILLMHNRYISNYKQLELANLLVAAEREEAAKEAAKMAAELAKNGYVLPNSRNLPSNNWFVAASIANNIGYVSNPRIDESSLQYQLGIGYNLSKNTSIQTGIAFGTRGFGMRKDQFTYKGDLSFEKNIKHIDANISVIDIPITLRYQLSDKENFGWFGTIGISTVFLKKEHYRITLDNSGTITYLDQKFENTNSILSMFNVSFGYQFPLTKRFTLTAEPYIQLPFKMIGEGGMKLSSVGFQIGGRYNFPKKIK